MRITTHRCAIALLVCVVQHAQAADIYKCTDAAGTVSYQSTPCAEGKQQSSVTIRKDDATPAPGSSQDPRAALLKRPPLHDVTDNYKKPTFAHNPAPSAPPRGPEPAPPGDVSYECRMSDGEIFYRHAACPPEITTASTEERHYPNGTWSPQVDYKYTVTSTKITREEACRQINRPGAAGREGRKYDQTVSTYDKNLGRDPCR
jgi:hypothetical protein